MAVKAKLNHVDGKVTIDLFPDQKRQWIAADPDDCDWRLYVYADHAKLEHGDYEVVGIEALDVSDITDESLASLSELDLPRVNVPEANIIDGTVGDVLRWARTVYPSRYSKASA